MPPRSTDGNPPSASFRPDCIQPELSVHLGGQTVTDARLHLGGAGTLWHNTLRRCPVPAWNIRNGDAAVKACLQLAGQGGGEGGVAGAVLGGGGPAAGLLLACRRLLRQRRQARCASSPARPGPCELRLRGPAAVSGGLAAPSCSSSLCQIAPWGSAAAALRPSGSSPQSSSAS